MSINLSKGQKIELGITNFSVGLGWTPNEGGGAEFDLDASVFLLNANKLIPEEEFFVFYNNKDSKDRAVHHSGDDRTGGNSDGGDDEVITVDINKLDDRIQELVFIVTIHEAFNRNQNFGQVKNSYIRIVDNTTNREIAKYELDEDFSIETAIEFGRVYKKDGVWKFDASGISYRNELEFFVNKYYKN